MRRDGDCDATEVCVYTSRRAPAASREHALGTRQFQSGCDGHEESSSETYPLAMLT